MPLEVHRHWLCRYCGLEIETFGPAPSLRYDDGCRAIDQGHGRYGAHAWEDRSERTDLIEIVLGSAARDDG
jgi:hypothetical protein